jgi:hypothetical protein
MTLLEIALDCIRRGWYVFPCWPKTKKPMTPSGFKDACLDEGVVRAWWRATPDANVAIATGPSGLCVQDIDHGPDEETFSHWLGSERTYIVRTGRRPEFGVQLYYSGSGLKSTAWKDGWSGDIRCATGYVMAAGSIHPSGEKYTIWMDAPLAPVPERLIKMTAKTVDRPDAVTVDDATADEWKTWLLEYLDRNELQYRDFEKRVSNGYWLGIHCPWEHEHSSGAGAESSTVLGILDGWLAFECSHGTCKAAGRDTQRFRDWVCDTELEPGVGPSVELGTGLPNPRKLDDPKTWEGIGEDQSVDPLSFFDTPDQILNAEPVKFVINNIIPKQRYVGFVALSGSRKTIVACNIIRSVLTGQPFLGKFEVDNPPDRVMFFAAESARDELKKRVQDLGLVSYLQDRKLLIRSAAADGSFHQDQLPHGLLQNSLIIFDTFICFFDGDDEKDATEARKFRGQMMRMVNAGATVIVLFHAPKGAKDVDAMSIESIRGSGELGAAMACGWALAMLGKDWSDNTRMEQVKRREFQCQPPLFDFSCDMNTAICTYVDEPVVVQVGGEKAKLDAKMRAFYDDGHQEWKASALEFGFAKANPDLKKPPSAKTWERRLKEWEA